MRCPVMLRRGKTSRLRGWCAISDRRSDQPAIIPAAPPG
jgi:hypothetical protein